MNTFHTFLRTHRPLCVGYEMLRWTKHKLFGWAEPATPVWYGFDARPANGAVEKNPITASWYRIRRPLYMHEHVYYNLDNALAVNPRVKGFAFVFFMGIGDYLYTTPVLEALKQKYPHVPFYAYVGAQFDRNNSPLVGKLLAENPHFEKVFYFDGLRHPLIWQNYDYSAAFKDVPENFLVIPVYYQYGVDIPHRVLSLFDTFHVPLPATHDLPARPARPTREAPSRGSQRPRRTIYPPVPHALPARPFSFTVIPQGRNAGYNAVSLEGPSLYPALKHCGVTREGSGVTREGSGVTREGGEPPLPTRNVAPLVPFPKLYFPKTIAPVVQDYLTTSRTRASEKKGIVFLQLDSRGSNYVYPHVQELAEGLIQQGYFVMSVTKGGPTENPDYVEIDIKKLSINQTWQLLATLKQEFALYVIAVNSVFWAASAGLQLPNLGLQHWIDKKVHNLWYPNIEVVTNYLYPHLPREKQILAPAQSYTPHNKKIIDYKPEWVLRWFLETWGPESGLTLPATHD